MIYMPQEGVVYQIGDPDVVYGLFYGAVSNSGWGCVPNSPPGRYVRIVVRLCDAER
jgi:hypothetical protein